VLAFTKLFMGDSDRFFNKSASAWKGLGYDLDGLRSTKTDENHCRLVAGANPIVKIDGDDGIDNTYGAVLIPIIGGLVANFSKTMSESLQNGLFTYLIRMDNLSLSPDQSGVRSSIYIGAGRGSPPSWNGFDIWPVTYESVVDGQVEQPRITLPSSYVSGGVWVSGSPADIVLVSSGGGLDMVLPIRRAIVSMRLSGSGSTARAVDGIIAGVTETEALIAELKKIAGSLSQSLCESDVFEGVAS
jgi:hypothetical protein